MPDGAARSAADRTSPVLPGSPRAPRRRRWPGPPIGNADCLNATYWHARWWVAKDKGLYGRLRIYRALVAEGTCRDLREAVIAMQEKWRQDRAELAVFYARQWRHGQYLKYRRHLARLSRIVHSAGGACAYCGDPNPRTIDHVDPRLPRGGADELNNLVRCCAQCNREKGPRTPRAWERDRRTAGLPWPPAPSPQRPHLPENVSSAQVSVIQLAVLVRLAVSGPVQLRSVLPITLTSLERRGFVQRSPDNWLHHTITDRGRLALETGRLPR